MSLTSPLYTEVQLEKLKVAAQAAIPRGVMELEAERIGILDDLFRSLVYRLKGYVLAERLPPETVSDSRDVTFDVPASWWQHWKQSHAAAWYARWLVKRRPVKHHRVVKRVALTVDLERYRTYPEARVSLPADTWGQVVRVAQWTDTWREQQYE